MCRLKDTQEYVLMGIKYFVFAVNKMDLVGYSEERFNEITKQIDELSKELGLASVKIILYQQQRVTILQLNLIIHLGIQAKHFLLTLKMWM